MIIVIVKKELLDARFAIVVTDHQVHWLATALFERIESSIRHLNKEKKLFTVYDYLPIMARLPLGRNFYDFQFGWEISMLLWLC